MVKTAITISTMLESAVAGNKILLSLCATWCIFDIHILVHTYTCLTNKQNLLTEQRKNADKNIKAGTTIHITI